jgi:NADH dehydrogenase
MPELHVVTGAFGFVGRHIARRLLEQHEHVRTLTNHPQPHLDCRPLDFADPGALADALAGASVLYNTYWVRFPYKDRTFERAVENSRTLIEAARKADVPRIVHVSITRPSDDSPFAYFRGKAAVEQAVLESGLGYGIVRPTVIFGRGDVFINNIAWLVRRFPLFPVPHPGAYPLQPVHVGDVARLCVEAGRADENVIVEAAGPEVFAFEELVRLMADALGTRTRVAHARPRIAFALARTLGLVLRDVLLTPEELGGLRDGLAVAQGPPTGAVWLSEWLREHARTVGMSYASELRRHYR